MLRTATRHLRRAKALKDAGVPSICCTFLQGRSRDEEESPCSLKSGNVQLHGQSFASAQFLRHLHSNGKDPDKTELVKNVASIVQASPIPIGYVRHHPRRMRADALG